MNKNFLNLPALLGPPLGKVPRRRRIGTGLVVGLIGIPLACAIAFFLICNRR